MKDEPKRYPEDDYVPLSQSDYRSSSGHGGLWIAVASNLGAVGLMLTLVTIPSGSEIRPMGHTFFAVMLGGLALVLAAPLCAISIFRSTGSQRALATLGLVLSLLPLPLSILTLILLTKWCGFSLSP